MARGIALSASPVLARARLSAGRSRFVLFVISLAFLALLARAFYLQGLSRDFLQAQGESRFARTLSLPAVRGKVTDRNGVVLAASVPARAIFAIPDEVRADAASLSRLAELLRMPEAELRRRLGHEDRSFVYLQRQVPLDLAERIAALQIPGVHQLPETRREYPLGPASAHVVGFTNIEDRGQEGVELAFNELLSGVPGNRRVIRDRLGRIVEDLREIVPPRDGEQLTLSIDSRIQSVVHQSLLAAVERHQALAATAVVIDVGSGELLAMASVPDFDPNDRSSFSSTRLRNRALTDTFEPGSTVKPLVIAHAMQLGRVSANTSFDTGNGRLPLRGGTVTDVRAYGVLDTAGVVAKSSNVGTVLIAQQLQAAEMWSLFNAVGFGVAPQTGFPGEVAGRLRPAERWRPIEQATMSYGYGLSVSLMQLTRSYLPLARGGDTVPLSIVRVDQAPESQQIFDPMVARQMRLMLEHAAGPEGTGPRAQVLGYRVAGKTGTARKIENGQYTTRYVASFVGFAPVSAPRIAVGVMVDEPTGQYFGGQVAAPVFSEIVGASLRLLGLQPDAPFASLIIPDNPVQESL